MSKNSAENLLKKLRRLDSNMACPNCDTHAQPGIGFGNVCVKFKTFVCDLCKTSHQAISHRVKSITMSNWTVEEVMELTSEQSGGNEACRHIWLANAPKCGGRYPGGARPKEGDKIDIFKQFVMDAYDLGKFRANTPYEPSGGDAHVVAESSSGNTKKAAAPRAAEVKPSGLKIAVNKPAPTAEMDLLGGFDDAPFGGATATNQGGAQFDPFGDSYSGQATPTSPWSSAVAASSPAPFTASFAASAPQQAAPPRNVSNEDMFANFGSAPAQSNFGATQSNGFDMFNSQNNSPVPSHNNSVSDFGGLLTPHSQSVSPVPPAAAAGGGADPFGNDDLTLLQPARTNNGGSFNAGGGMSGAQTWHNSPARGGGVGFGSMNTTASNSSGNSFNSMGGGLPPAPQQMRSTSAPMSMMNSSGGGGVMGGGGGGVGGAGGYGVSSPMGSGYRPGGGQSPMMMGAAGGGAAGGVMMGGVRPMGSMGGGASAISNINSLAVNNTNNNGGGANKNSNSFDFVQSAMNHHLGSASPIPLGAPSANSGVGNYSNNNNNNGRFNAMGGTPAMGGGGYQGQQQYRANPPTNPFAK